MAGVVGTVRTDEHIIKPAKAIPGSYGKNEPTKEEYRHQSKVSATEWISQMAPLSGYNLAYWLDSHNSFSLL